MFTVSKRSKVCKLTWFSITNGKHLRSTNFVSVRLMLLLSRLTHYGAIKDNKSVKKTGNRRKTVIYIAVKTSTFFNARGLMETAHAKFSRL